MRLKLLICLLGFLAILPQVHGEKLRWDWRAGDVYDVTLKSNVDIHVTTAGQQLHYVNQFDVNGEWAVEEVNSSHIARIHWSVQRIQLASGQGDNRLQVDTDVAAGNEDEETVLAALQPLLRKRFELLVNDQARLSVVKEMRPSSGADRRVSPKPNTQAKAIPAVFNSEGVAGAFKHVFIEFPFNDVRSGAQWKKQHPLSAPEPAGKIEYEYQGKTTEHHRIAIQGEVEFSQDPDRTVKVKQQSLEGMALLSLKAPQITKVQLDLQLETESDGQQGDEGKTKVIHRETDVIEIKKRLR